MKFKVGDKVKLVSMKNENDYYKKYLGRTYTISRIGTNHRGKFANLKETDDISPFLQNLELVKNTYTYEDLKKNPIGTRVIFESGDILIKTRENFYTNNFWNKSNEDLKMLEGGHYLGKIIKIEEPTYTTVYEANKEILDEAEKRYLKEVVRPYKNVKSILKYIYPGNRLESIMITVLDLENEDWLFTLPPFETGKMYKNMEDNKAYTTEELGL